MASAASAARDEENAGAVAPERIITATSFPPGILSGEKAFRYSQTHGLPSPFTRRRGPYVIIGHGYEELVPFDERPLVPPGITLVTNILAGVTSTMPQTCGMINMLSREENRDMVTNPVASRFDMKRMLLENDIEHLHVYTEGQRMPKLSVTLLGDFSDSIKKEVGGKRREFRYYKIFHSGVQEFPLQPYEGDGDDEIKISNKLTNITGNNVRAQNSGYIRGHERKCLGFEKRYGDELYVDDINEIYKDSLHPTPEYVTSIISQINTQKIPVSNLGVLLGDIPITDIFAQNGPGIYYFIACRADKKENSLLHTKFLNLRSDLNNILHPNWLFYTNNDGVEKTDMDPETFYKEFRISPYEVDFVRELVELISILLMSPMDMETKKLIIRQRLDELPESVDRALHNKKYFVDSFVDDFKIFVDKTSAPKQLIRQASLEQQVRNRNVGAGGGAPRRRTRGGARRGRRVSLRQRRNRN